MFLCLPFRTNLQASLGDTDVSNRLKALGVLKASSNPSAKTHWLRKVLSRFVKDYPLQALLHDLTMARTITAVVAVAEKQKISPDEAAADMPAGLASSSSEVGRRVPPRREVSQSLFHDCSRRMEVPATRRHVQQRGPRRSQSVPSLADHAHAQLHCGRLGRGAVEE